MGGDAMMMFFVFFCFALLCLAYSIWCRVAVHLDPNMEDSKMLFFYDEHSVVRSGEVEDKTPP